jgi:hypothetical protein
MPVKQLHLKVQQLFFIPTILFLLHDTEGKRIYEDHPFVNYLKLKISYFTTAIYVLEIYAIV